jgi:hypothetical protein
MPSHSPDLPPTLSVVVVALIAAIVASQLWNRYLARTPRLRMLTGSRTQRAALRIALSPVLQEFLPLLDRAGQEVRAIVVVPTLTGGDGQPLAAEIEQLAGSATFIVRVAHRVGPGVRQSDEVAGVLAENLLCLFREAASATVVRQTPAPAIHGTPTQDVAAARPVRRNPLSTLPRHVAQNEAEETLVAFKPSPLGRANNTQGS